MPTSPLPAAVVADANVLLSALIGGRARNVLAHPLGPRALAPVEVRAEIAHHLPSLGQRRGLDLTKLLEAFELLPVEWQKLDVYSQQRGEAQRRMASRDPDDWPTVALALTLSLPIWSQDKDLSIAGVALFTTGQILDMLLDHSSG